MTEYTVWGAKRNGIRLGFSYQGYSLGTNGVTGKPTTALASPVLKLDSGTKDLNDSNNNLNWSGSGVVADGAADSSISGKGVRVLQALSALEVDTNYGAQAVLTVTATLSGLGAAGGNLTVSAVLTGPVIPYLLPDAPSGLSVARVHDHLHNLAFTNHADAANGKPYQRLYVERQEAEESAPWLQVGTINNGVATTYGDPTTQARTRYRYRIRAWNSSGYSDYAAETGWVVTYPGPPTNLAATKSGSTVTLTWTPAEGYLTGYQVLHTDPDTLPLAWDVLEPALGPEAATATHTGASLATRHRYVVQATANSGGTAPIAMATGAEITVSLLSPPNAPRLELASSSGTTVDATDTPVTVRITHQPTDATIQLGAKVKWADRLGDSTEVEIGSLTSYTIPAGTLTNADGPYTVAAKTKGGHADYGPYSTAVLITDTRPQVTPVTPSGTVETTNTPWLEWGYFDAEATGQAAWEVRVYNHDTGALLEQATDVGPWTYYAVTAAAGLREAVNYRWEARARDGAGLWSAWASALFTIDVAAPPVPTLSQAAYLPGLHAVALDVAVAAPGAGENPAHQLSVYRMDGTASQLIGYAEATEEAAPIVLAVVDPIPPLGVTLTYRVESLTYEGGASNLEVEVETLPTGGAVLNGGPGYTVHAYTADNASIANTADREKVLERYEGRTLPLAYWADAQTDQVRVSGQVDTVAGSGVVDGDWQALLELAKTGAPLCYRDLFGRRWFGAIDAPSATTSAADGDVTVVEFTFTRTGDSE